ncbi:hypothetical protein EUX98_g1456 [Antrodiella citrinella]|uniref:Thioester reductase (TE) domain-containing protein n=1 Tax=Antrodiella citrinella TaxID=2447956 RepID=A0A4S4N4H9_9APHY|nr:hypothetical protein EUX98_g1456 [Antrodiella citrinella]
MSASKPYPGLSVPDEDAIVAEMLGMVARYSQSFPTHKPSRPAPQKHTILLTGATGVLGATLLSLLVPTPEVARIYVVNRRSPTGVPLLQRQMEAVAEAGFDAQEVLSSPKIVLLETNLPEERIGLSDELVEEIRNSVTHIIHNAYLVNFNVPLAGFDPNVKTLWHLCNLALASALPTPPRVMFVSTADVWSKKPVLTGPVPEIMTDARWATRGGYGESKWVCENILNEFAQNTPLCPIFMRVGQISGGQNGAWNSHDWVPAIIRSSVNCLGCLPSLDYDVPWIPGNIVAKAIIEMRDSPYMVHHLEHPRPVAWNTLFRPMADTLHIPLVPYETWLDRLEESGRTIRTPSEIEAGKRTNPAWTLINMFRGVVASSERAWRRAVGQAIMDMTHSLEVAPSLGEESCPQLTREDAVKWLHFWRSIGVLEWQVRAKL